MKKVLALILATMLLCLTVAAAAEGEEKPLFATIGDALAVIQGTDYVRGGDGKHCIVVVKVDGKYVRAVADLDETAQEKYKEIQNVEDIEAAMAAYDEYEKTLAVAYTEEITAVPKTQAELDAEAGKTMDQLEDEGYEYCARGSGGENDPVVFTMAYGLYAYDFTVNEPLSVYEESEDFTDLTVKSGVFSGISVNALDLRFHADGTEDPEEDIWSGYGDLLQKINDAIEAAEANGEADLEAVITALTAEMPDQADEIRELAAMLFGIALPSAEEAPKAE